MSSLNQPQGTKFSLIQPKGTELSLNTLENTELSLIQPSGTELSLNQPSVVDPLIAESRALLAVLGRKPQTTAVKQLIKEATGFLESDQLAEQSNKASSGNEPSIVQPSGSEASHFQPQVATGSTKAPAPMPYFTGHRPGTIGLLPAWKDKVTSVVTMSSKAESTTLQIRHQPQQHRWIRRNGLRVYTRAP